MFVESAELDEHAGGDREAGYDDVEWDDTLDRICATLEPRLEELLRQRVAGRHLDEIAADLGITPEWTCKLARGPLADAVADFLKRVA